MGSCLIYPLLQVAAASVLADLPGVDADLDQCFVLQAEDDTCGSEPAREGAGSIAA